MDNADVQVVSASEENAYPGTVMQRTMAIINDPEFDQPFTLDLLSATSDSKNQYDLPYYYHGQLLEANFDLKTPVSLKPLGKTNGYQHLFLEASGVVDSTNAKFSWMKNDKFYTLTTVAGESDEILLARIGANDPDFNLRRDPALIVRRDKAANTLFASIIEPHGNYDVVSESATNAESNIEEMTVLHDDEAYTDVSIKTVNGNARVFIVANRDFDKSTEHTIDISGKTYSWSGPFSYFING